MNKLKKNMSWKKSLGNVLKEVRFIIAPKKSGAYNFINNYKADINKNFPNFPFVIRECEGIDDFVVMRYNYGVERKENINDLTMKQIEDIFENSVNDANKVNSTL